MGGGNDPRIKLVIPSERTKLLIRTLLISEIKFLKSSGILIETMALYKRRATKYCGMESCTKEYVLLSFVKRKNSETTSFSSDALEILSLISGSEIELVKGFRYWIEISVISF